MYIVKFIFFGYSRVIGFEQNMEHKEETNEEKCDRRTERTHAEQYMA